jgi:hypothetical protein
MFHKLEQNEMDCTSIMIDMSASTYLELVDKIYHDRQGGIVGQRAPLKTKTAKTIREQMVRDITRGVMLPPLVIGIVAGPAKYASLSEKIKGRDDFIGFLNSIEADSLSIIDGMQRTTAIKEAMDRSGPQSVSDLRVEFWVSEHTNNLIYRMLVLNTGQVPWDIARQLEAIYRPLLQRIESAVGGEISFLSKDIGRRANLDANQYETEDVVELLLIFSSRKRELNLKDQIAQDFVRLDMIESSSHSQFIQYFCDAISILSKFNGVISRFEANHQQRKTLSRYVVGSEVFKGFPAKAGFIAAMSVFLFSRPGFETDWTKVPDKFQRIHATISRLIASLERCGTSDDMEEILQLESLEERIGRHRVAASQVGRFEREYFEKAFSVLFEEGENVRTLEPCWAAY